MNLITSTLVAVQNLNSTINQNLTTEPTSSEVGNPSFDVKANYVTQSDAKQSSQNEIKLDINIRTPTEVVTPEMSDGLIEALGNLTDEEPKINKMIDKQMRGVPSKVDPTVALACQMAVLYLDLNESEKKMSAANSDAALNQAKLEKVSIKNEAFSNLMGAVGGAAISTTLGVAGWIHTGRGFTTENQVMKLQKDKSADIQKYEVKLSEVKTNLKQIHQEAAPLRDAQAIDRNKLKVKQAAVEKELFDPREKAIQNHKQATADSTQQQKNHIQKLKERDHNITQQLGVKEREYEKLTTNTKADLEARKNRAFDAQGKAHNSELDNLQTSYDKQINQSKKALENKKQARDRALDDIDTRCSAACEKKTGELKAQYKDHAEIPNHVLDQAHSNVSRNFDGERQAAKQKYTDAKNAHDQITIDYQHNVSNMKSKHRGERNDLATKHDKDKSERLATNKEVYERKTKPLKDEQVLIRAERKQKKEDLEQYSTDRASKLEKMETDLVTDRKEFAEKTKQDRKDLKDHQNKDPEAVAFNQREQFYAVKRGKHSNKKMTMEHEITQLQQEARKFQTTGSLIVGQTILAQVGIQIGGLDAAEERGEQRMLSANSNIHEKIADQKNQNANTAMSNVSQLTDLIRERTRNQTDVMGAFAQHLSSKGG